MLSAATAQTATGINGRGVPVVLQIGRDRQPKRPLSVQQGAMWPVGHAPTFPIGHVWCHSAIQHGWIDPAIWGMSA
jgi:hypothetical protein